jgi:hypothetical protein
MSKISEVWLLPCALVFLLLASTSFAQQVNFSGTYVLAGANGDLRFDPKMKDQPILKVTQTTDELQTALTKKDGTETMNLPLNGSEVSYTTLSGETGKARVETKGKQMRIRKVLQPKSYSNIPRGEIYTVENWKLSKDGRILKICGTADVRGGVVQFQKSGCQIFKRR